MLETIFEKKDGYFKMNVIKVQPLNIHTYVQNLQLDLLNVTIEVGYNERLKKRWISVKTADNTVLLRRTFLDVNRRVDLNNNATLLGLSYYIILDKKPNGFDNKNFLEWSDNYYISFVGVRREVNDYINNKYREIVVGN